MIDKPVGQSCDVFLLCGPMLLIGPQATQPKNYCSYPKMMAKRIGAAIQVPWGQQLQLGAPNFPLLSNISNFLLGDPEALPGQLGEVAPPFGPRSAPGSLPSGTCSGDLPRETLGRHP